MRKLFIASAILSLSSAAYAADTGLYAGAQAGYASTGFNTKHFTFNAGDLPNSNLSHIPGTSSQSDDLAGRIFAGYQFTPYVALEAGFTQFSDVHNTLKSDGVKVLDNKIEEQATDIAVKGIYPFCNTGIAVYGKVGEAYVEASEHLNVFDGLLTDSASTHAFRPELGAGVSYNLNQNVAASLDYTLIAHNSTLRNINFVGVGLTYHFA